MTITKFYIFDFDGTLMNTPLPNPGKQEYERLTGNKYPHIGWWGRLESLDPMFNIKPFPAIHDEYKKATADGGLTVLMTNRMFKHQDRVKELLTEHGMTFDIYSFKSGRESKRERTLQLLRGCPNVSYIEVWDDMDEHLAEFHRLKEERPEIIIKINKVDNGRSALMTA